MAADVDEANSTFGHEASRESNRGAEQLRSLLDGQQLFHDWASCGARWRSATFGCFTVSTEPEGHHEVARGAGNAALRVTQLVLQLRPDEATSKCMQCCYAHSTVACPPWWGAGRRMRRVRGTPGAC